MWLEHANGLAQAQVKALDAHLRDHFKALLGNEMIYEVRRCSAEQL